MSGVERGALEAELDRFLAKVENTNHAQALRSFYVASMRPLDVAHAQGCGIEGVCRRALAGLDALVTAGAREKVAPTTELAKALLAIEARALRVLAKANAAKREAASANAPL